MEQLGYEINKIRRDLLAAEESELKKLNRRLYAIATGTGIVTVAAASIVFYPENGDYLLKGICGISSLLNGAFVYGDVTEILKNNESIRKIQARIGELEKKVGEDCTFF